MVHLEDTFSTFFAVVGSCGFPLIANKTLFFLFLFFFVGHITRILKVTNRVDHDQVNKETFSDKFIPLNNPNEDVVIV